MAQLITVFSQNTTALANKKHCICKSPRLLAQIQLFLSSSLKYHFICPTYHCLLSKYHCIFPKFHFAFQNIESINAQDLSKNKKFMFCETSLQLRQGSRKWISLSVKLGLHRNYIYKEKSQNQNILFASRNILSAVLARLS